MQKSQTQAIILPFWTFTVLVTVLVGLFPALLYCIGEIVVLKSRFEQQQQTIEYLENVTAQIQRRTVGDDFSSSETQEAHQSFTKWKESEIQQMRQKRNTGTTKNDSCRCRRGPKGERGPKGQKGSRGRKGRTGPKGDTGALGNTGPPGRDGQKGNMGERGEPGPPGQPGSMFQSTDSAHIVGYGEHINPPRGTTKFHRITNWRLGHITGSIKFVSNSFLVIGTTGYYFVYSQLFYYAGDTLLMGHYTYINEEPVMRSLSSVVSEERKYNTNYHGAVFLLKSGDKISVRIPFTKSYFMHKETSYFGAFLISPVLNTTTLVQPTNTSQDFP
ncbi:C1q-related factor-like isoform X1 [Stylophora pistillata]|uniref:C1q-related factor-like isoform X1 n=1 Tax=Stylophora pistillata TaxID=50429 RepID=UPI000C0424B6|nr:C1q-related factor-like isoform X1 [Stylophora pistillata]